jgi:outer membrane protein
MNSTSQQFSLRGLKAPAALFCASLVLAVTNGPAQATPAPNETQLAAYEAAPETERVQLLIHLAKSGAHDQAESLLQQFPLQGQHAANRTLYLEGLILKARRDYTGATEKFRAALASDPSLTLVRADLAQTLVILEQDDSAVYHLKQLAAGAPNEAAAKDLQDFMQMVDERSPFKRSFWIAAAPTTNANLGSTSTSSLLPGWTAAAPEKAAGVSAGANVGFSKRIGNDYAIAAGAGLNGSVYDDEDYNALSFNQSLEVRRLTERGHIGVGIATSQVAHVQDKTWSSYAYGPRVSVRHAINQRTSVNGSAAFEWRDYNEDYNVGSDGTALLLNAEATHVLGNGFSITGSAGFTDVNAENDWKAYHTVSGGLSMRKELPLGITAELSGKLDYSVFDGPLMFGPIDLGIREDWKTVASVELTKRDLNILGFAPALNYTYTNNDSSIFLYNYDSHAVDVRFTKDF